MIARFSARPLAVQVVAAASASLSAAYYATQAPEILLNIAGWVLNPVAIGLGLTAFALDLVKPQMLRAAGTPGDGPRRVAAGLIFAVLFVASMIAVDGMMMKFRSDWAAGRGNAISAHKDAKDEVDRLANEFAALGPSRPVAAIQADVKNFRIDPALWRRSAQCEDATKPDTQAYCAPLLELYKERGTAARKAEIEPKLSEARAKLESIDPPKAADPQAAVLAAALGKNEEFIAYLMVAILGFAVELVACLGMWVLDRRPQVQQGTSTSPAPITDEQRALEWVLGEMAKSGGKLTVLNAAVAKRFDVDPATVTRWRQRWIADGKIREEKTGRQITLALAI